MKYRLTNAFKVKHQDHDKIVSPEETIKNFKHHCERAGLNILKETRRIDNGRLDIPVYYSVCGHDAHILTGTRKQMGKGVSPVLAEASAVMELAERFSIYSYKSRPSVITRGTWKEMDTPVPLDLIAASVQDRRPPEAAMDLFSHLPFQWTRAWNLTQDQEVQIPLDWFFMINEFNGSSAGNCMEEAICQGACEIVERHVSAVVCREEKALPYIDPASVTHPPTRELIHKFTRRGIRLYINDFSLDTGIPTVGVLAYDPSTVSKTSEIVWTAGTAASPDKALSRALTEVAQLAGDFNTNSNYVASGLPKFKTLSQAHYIVDPLDSGTGRIIPLSDLPDISSPNILDEIQAVIQALKGLGMDLIIVDTTDPRLTIPACYTLVPGTAFRERAENSSVVMFCAKHIYETHPPHVALDLLTQAAQDLPDQYEISFYIGCCHLAMEAPDKAQTCLEKALTQNPSPQDLPTIYSYTGVCLKELGQYDAALQVLEKGIALDDEREDIYNLMGFCHFMGKRHHESIRCFQEVLKLNPASGIDHASIASNYRELGETEKAVDFYEMALVLDPDLEFARENLEKLTLSRSAE